MKIHLQVSDDRQRTLTLDGDLDLLDQLLAAIKAERDGKRDVMPADVPRPIVSTVQGSKKAMTLDELSP